MLEEVTRPQLVLAGIIVAASALLLTERIRNDLVALLIVISLAATGILRPREALGGFGSEPAIVVAAVLVLSAALHQTGLSETLGRWIGRLAGRTLARAIAVIMPSVALLSAFTHHLTITAVMLPVTMRLADERGLPASKLLMPLSFAASLGTAITIIGAPAFLIASGVLQQAGRPGLGIFSIAPIGLALTVAGTLYVLAVGRRLLPERRGSGQGDDRFKLEHYFTELLVLPQSRLVGKRIADIERAESPPLTVVGRLRDGRRLRGPWRERPVRAGDVLLLRSTPDQLVAFRADKGVELHPVAQYDERAPGQADADEVSARLVQAVVAPRSELIGRTLGELDFRRRYGAIVVGLWRRRDWLDAELARVPLRAGDVLVLEGSDEALQRVAGDGGFLMLVPFHGEPRLARKAWAAAAIMLGTVAAAALGMLSVEVAALAGAVAVVLTGCLTGRQAYRAIDGRIYVFIAGAIPLGMAMERTGLASLLAQGLHGLVEGWSQPLVLLALFWVVGIVTQFMSDAATTALFAPMALALGQALGHAPEAYVVTVSMAAVCSFLTPIGHHGNLLVYAPGGYQFRDFVKVGTPLTAAAACVVAFLAPLIWPG